MAKLTKSKRDALILQWQPFLKSMARKYTLRDHELEDYIQQGNIGLLLAMEKWNPKHGTFMTYGEYAARDQMRQYSRINQRIVSTPMETFSNVRKIRDLKQKGLSHRAIANKLKIKNIHVEMAINYEFGVPLEKMDIEYLENNERDLFLKHIERKFKSINSMIQKNIILHLVKGFNQKEISKILGIHKIYITSELQQIRNLVGNHANTLQQ